VFSFTDVIESKRIEKNILFNLRGQFRVDREVVHCHPSIVENIVSGLLEDFNQSAQ
jgi:hypothetical protein